MSRDLTTESERVAWAISRSGKTLQQLGAEIGCTHATLSQWTNGHTTIAKAKVGLVYAFAKATGVNLEWLLTGDGPAISSYGPTLHPLVEAARLLAQENGPNAETALRLLKALESR